MMPSEKVAVFTFLGSILAVYVAAFGMLLKVLAERWKGKPQTLAPSAVWLRRVILTLASLGVVCFAYGYFVEPYWPEITHIQIKSPKLANATRPIRIVHVSDLHSDPKPRLEERLPDLVAAQKPDLIVFTGDAINSPEGLPVFRRCLSHLARIAPTFVVKGNFDAFTWPGVNLYGDTGAQELNGNVAELQIAGTRVWLAGIGMSYENKIVPMLARAPADELTIFIYHTPDRIEEVSRFPVDLYLAGHTHGGQVALPFYGALVVLSDYGKRFESGLHRVGQTWLYVNRGIGMEGFSAPRVRFWCRPEITVIELRPGRLPEDAASVAALIPKPAHPPHEPDRHDGPGGV